MDTRRVRRWLLVTGVLMLLGGAAAILIPAAASVTIAIFIGWLLVYAGIVQLVHAIRRRHTGRSRAWTVVQAVLTLAAGVYIVVAPLSGTITLTVVLAAWFMVSGALQLATWWTERGQPGAGLIAFNGVLSTILGILIAVSLPSSAAWAIGLLVGIDLLFWGTRVLMAASMLKPVAEHRPRHGTAATA
jgi:uncharacterized membrane protein HdeD (DUF308 family)